MNDKNDSFKNMDNFENPNNEPLDKVEVVIYKDGIPKIVPALSAEMSTNVYVLKYIKPEIHHEDGSEIIGAKDTWLQTINYIIDDYVFLLKLPFHCFWSTVLFCSSYLDSLKSVLELSPKFYELNDFPTDEKMISTLNTLHKKLINIFARLATRKISPSKYLSKGHHAQLLYNNFLITVPIMMQLSQLFGRENPKIISHVIKKSVQYQRRYHDDYKVVLQILCEVLEMIDEKLSDRFKKNQTPKKDVLYISNTDNKKTSKGLNYKEIEDMIIYLLDFSSNIEIFLYIHPPIIEYFSNDYFLMKITYTYENIFPELYKKFEKFMEKNRRTTKYEEMKKYLMFARIKMVKIFRAIIFKGLSSVLKQPDVAAKDNVKEVVDEFMNYLTSIVSDKYLMNDYNKMFPIIDDLELIRQLTSDVDPVKESFLLRLATEVIPNYCNNVSSNNSFVEPMAGPSGMQNFVNTTSTSSNVTSINEAELKSLISHVKDVMYDFGEGFIQKCLEYYNFNTESVINAILEDSLPSELKQLDRQLAYINPESRKFSEISVNNSNTTETLVGGMKSLDIYDDEICDRDIKKTNNDSDSVSKIGYGKRKNQYKNLNEMLNDKSFKNQVAESYSKYSTVEDYDDEYDDTYDGQNDGIMLLDDDMEIDFRRFTTPRVLQKNYKFEKPEDDEADEGEETNKESTLDGTNDRNNFVQDPSVLRARAEQRRQSKQEKNNRGGRRNFGNVVGNPKGQGNDPDVLKNRDKKNTHKASRGNHHRRSGAEWKRRQGMMPP